LRPFKLSNDDQTSLIEGADGGEGSDNDDVAGMGEDDDVEENFVETNECDGLTFEEAMGSEIEMITEFAKGLQYQIQF
jgi:hypothetical protein